MARGKPVPHEVQWMIVRLSGMLSKENISYGTGVSIRTVERILREFSEHGTVQEGKERKGRRRLLGCDEAAVCPCQICG
jgi:transposase